MNAFGGSRLQVKAPERGVFPLDHDGECTEPMEAYLKCLFANKNDQFPCKPLSKSYLKCRMDTGLMAKDDLDNLGFAEGKPYIRNESVIKEGPFLAGLDVKPSNKWLFFSTKRKE